MPEALSQNTSIDNFVVLYFRSIKSSRFLLKKNKFYIMDEENKKETVEEKKGDFPAEKTPEAKPKFVKILIWVIVVLLVIWLVALISTKKNPVELPDDQNIEEEMNKEGGEEQEVESEIEVGIEEEEEEE